MNILVVTHSSIYGTDTEVKKVYNIEENITLEEAYTDFTKQYWLSKGVKEENMELSLETGSYGFSPVDIDNIEYPIPDELNKFLQYIKDTLKGTELNFVRVDIQSDLDTY